MHIYTLLYTLPGVGWMADGRQPRGTGRSARCFVAAWMGGMERVGRREMQEGGDMGTCVYV